MWFERLFGFEEETPEQVRSNLEVKGDRIRSRVNGKELIFGELEILSLHDLRSKISLENYSGKLQVEEVIGNVQTMHSASENNGAIFQAASQFNLLEMVGPHVVPERGVGIYEYDLTQGPACAIACGAGTVYRNYYVKVNGQIGQTRNNQIDCLDEISQELENDSHHFWEMSNGYVLPVIGGLETIASLIQQRTRYEYDQLKSKLKVGIQWNTQVTLNESENLVSQVYCSALPVAYSSIPSDNWEPFARLVLEATYESTLYAALINFKRTGNNKVYLTLVGGGAFGNDRKWIFDAMRLAFNKFISTPLDIKIVSYGNSNQSIRDFASSFNEE